MAFCTDILGFYERLLDSLIDCCRVNIHAEREMKDTVCLRLGNSKYRSAGRNIIFYEGLR